MKEKCIRTTLVLFLAIASISCISNQQQPANQLLGEWSLGIADPEGEKGFIFREGAILRFENRYLYMQGPETTVKIEYAIDGNYMTFIDEGKPSNRMRIQFLDKNSFILYLPSIKEMIGDNPTDKNVTIIGGDEVPFMAGKRK